MHRDAAEKIPAESIIHLYFSFGYVKPNTYEIIPMVDGNGDEADAKTMKDVVKRKKCNPGLKVVIALSGWTFNDNHGSLLDPRAAYYPFPGRGTAVTRHLLQTFDKVMHKTNTSDWLPFPCVWM